MILGDPSRSYAVSAPADRDASQLCYSYRIIKGGGGGGDPSRSYAVSAPADRDASQLCYSYRIIKGGGGGGDPSRSYAVSAPADRDASQLCYSYRIIKGGGGGGILVVVTQCLLLPTGTHHSYTTHTVSLRGGGRGGGGS